MHAIVFMFLPIEINQLQGKEVPTFHTVKKCVPIALGQAMAPNPCFTTLDTHSLSVLSNPNSYGHDTNLACPFSAIPTKNMKCQLYSAMTAS